MAIRTTLTRIDVSPSSPTNWSGRVKIGTSVLLLLHLAAVLVGPLAVEPTSRLFRTAWAVVHPYLDIAYLNHGYHFFAPEPGPSHLIRYELELPDGRRETGYFPNKEVHRPRLLYHRHFMLAEHINALAENSETATVAAAYADSFGKHLLHKHKAQRVNLYLMRHLLPQADQVANGLHLDDASLYREKLLGTYTTETL